MLIRLPALSNDFCRVPDPDDKEEQMKILIIQHVACEGPGLLGDKLRNDGWETDIRCMDIPGTSLPVHLDSYQALLILGGPMGAYEENIYPYLYQVEELIREAAAKNIPTAGICLGAQLIARALGAEVFPNPQKEIGWSGININEEGKSTRLFHNLPDTLPVFQWHGDTFSLPEGARLLASGEICRNQTFLYGENIWALQFHPEITPEMIRLWSEAYQEELNEFAGPGAAARLQEDTRDRWDGMHVWRTQMLKNLAAVLKGEG